MTQHSLDPAVVRALRAWTKHDEAWGCHPQDRQRWMGVFLALAKNGFSWWPDDILYWLRENFPGADESEIQTIRDFGEMAQALHPPESSDSLESDSLEWIEIGENIARTAIESA